MTNFFQCLKDFLITLILWGYFLFGYLAFLLTLYLPAYIFTQNSMTALQMINHVFLKGFFGLTRLLIPGITFSIDDKVRSLRSAVLVCNHISYLDPILLIALTPRQRTIVKKTFFHVPIFGWFLKRYGFIPSAPSEMLGEAMIRNLESIKEHLADGGNLFIFPEGTRSRDGKLAPFNKGVFSIARYCGAPLRLIYIKGTDKLFRPGSFLFDTHSRNEIAVELISSIEPDELTNNFSVAAAADFAYRSFLKKMAGKDNASSGEIRWEVNG